MQEHPSRSIPSLLTAGALLVVALLVIWSRYDPRIQLLRRLENMTYDARVRLTLRDDRLETTNLAIAVIDDQSYRIMLDGTYERYGIKEDFPWRRYYYGRAVRELTTQGASVIGFDILLGTEDNREVLLEDGTRANSDFMFARQMREAGNVVLVEAPEGDALQHVGEGDAQLRERLQNRLQQGVVIPEIFRTNAAAIGIVTAPKDADGVIRRFKLFDQIRRWHPAVFQVANALGLDLTTAQVTSNQLVIRGRDFPDGHRFDLNPDGTLRMDDLGGGPSAKPFINERLWHFGIVAAARALQLDLEHPEIHPDRVVLSGPNGLRRAIPVDRDGYGIIDWSVRLQNTNLLAIQMHTLIANSFLREEMARLSERPAVLDRDALQAGSRGIQLVAQTNDLPALYRNKIVLIGSTAKGNNLTDLGPTPLDRETYLLSVHLNVAHGMLLDRFVRKGGLTLELLSMVGLGLISAWLTLRAHVYMAPVGIGAILLLYSALSLWAYSAFRFWMPVFAPIAGGLFVPHFVLLTYRLLSEQRSKRHIRSVFARVVAPEVVQELLSAQTLALGGARRNVTVLFADVRGFTEMTDASQARAEDYARTKGLTGQAAEDYFNAQAKETLDTVNVYLATIADMVKKHRGTLDKYIGDCVMAFWGAPIANPRHALACVQAAIDAQRALYALNQDRFAENKRREQENVTRAAAGLDPLSMLALLTCGTGINTGESIVGLMGSAAHIFNYTVFGREVNLASRLEGVSGRGRIIISESTFQELKRDDPELAATCLPQPPVSVKGIRGPVRIYEVPWKLSAPAASAAAETVLSSPKTPALLGKDPSAASPTATAREAAETTSASPAPPTAASTPPRPPGS